MNSASRPSGRRPDQMRNIRFTRNYTRYAEGSVLVEFGDTRVVCTATVSDQVPKFIKGKTQGWVTAEYGMLPRSTSERTIREAARGKQGGRTLEIQRLIGRSLRSAVNLKGIPGYAVTVDCDVIQADGGTRTASISGGFVALHEAVTQLANSHCIPFIPVRNFVAAVSVGIVNNIPVLDLDYEEDCQAHTDMNIVMNDADAFIEVQGTAEQQAFSRDEFASMLDLASLGVREVIRQQKLCLDK